MKRAEIENKLLEVDLEIKKVDLEIRKQQAEFIKAQIRFENAKAEELENSIKKKSIASSGLGGIVHRK